MAQSFKRWRTSRWRELKKWRAPSTGPSQNTVIGNDLQPSKISWDYSFKKPQWRCFLFSHNNSTNTVNNLHIFRKQMINLREMTKILSLVVYIKLTNVVIASDRLESTQWWQSVSRWSRVSRGRCTHVPPYNTWRICGLILPCSCIMLHTSSLLINIYEMMKCWALA